jgi:hypothetical protein
MSWSFTTSRIRGGKGEESGISGFRKNLHIVQATAFFLALVFFLPIIIMTPLQDFMAAAGFSVKHGDSQTEVCIVSDNAKGLKVRTSSTPAQNIWLVSSKNESISSISTSRVCCTWWQPSKSFASDMTEPESDSSSEFCEQESGSPRSPAGTIMVPLTDHRPPQEVPADQEQKEQRNVTQMSSVVVLKKENNADHQKVGVHDVPRPPMVKKLSRGLAYPVNALKGHPRELRSPTKSPAAA